MKVVDTNAYISVLRELVEHVWIHMIKVRRPVMNIYGKLMKRIKRREQ